MSRLFYIPILHTEKEVGLIQGSEGGAQSAGALLQMWAGIQRKLENLKAAWERVRIYQVALPVCGKERQIVEQLAKKGSPNHRLIRYLLKKGATLEGTEDPNLLLKEYDLLSTVFQGGDNDLLRAEYRSRSEAILAERDQFIAGRTRETLKSGEMGLLFIGVRHKVDQLLKHDFDITYIIYRIPFEAVKTVYNL